MDYKTKALDHVRSVCPELMELSFGCEVLVLDDEDNRKEKEVAKFVRVDDKDEGNIWADVYVLRPKITGGYGRRLMVGMYIHKIIGHTPHLEHWLRGIESAEANLDTDYAVTHGGRLIGAKHMNDGSKELWNDTTIECYNLTKDEQSEEFYKAYCEITNCE